MRDARGVAWRQGLRFWCNWEPGGQVRASFSIQRKKNIHDKSFNKSKFSNSAIVSSNHLWLLQRHVITHYEGDQCRLGLPSAHPCPGDLRTSAPPLCARPARQVLAGHFSVCTPGTERKRHEVSHQALLRSQQLWRLSSGKEHNIKNH